MATPPTFVREDEIAAWNSTTSPQNLPAFTPGSGDLLLAFMAADNSDGTTNDMSISGGVTWSNVRDVPGTISADCYARCMSATGAGGSITPQLSASIAAGPPDIGANVLEFSNHGGIGASAATTNGVTGTHPTLNITTTGDNSAIAVIFADFNAVAVPTGYDSVNGSAPTVQTQVQVATRYTISVVWYADAGPAGSKTVGATYSVAAAAQIIAVEIKGTAAAGGFPTAPRGPLAGHFRASVRSYDSGIAAAVETYSHGAETDSSTSDVPAGTKTGVGPTRTAGDTDDDLGTGIKTGTGAGVERASATDRPGAGIKTASGSTAETVAGSGRPAVVKIGLGPAAELAAASGRPAGLKRAVAAAVDATDLSDPLAGKKIAAAATVEQVSGQDRLPKGESYTHGVAETLAASGRPGTGVRLAASSTRTAAAGSEATPSRKVGLGAPVEAVSGSEVALGRKIGVGARVETVSAAVAGTGRKLTSGAARVAATLVDVLTGKRTATGSTRSGSGISDRIVTTVGPPPKLPISVTGSARPMVDARGSARSATGSSTGSARPLVGSAGSAGPEIHATGSANPVIRVTET